MARLIIATRASVLALWQAEHVRTLLQRAHPQLTVELLPMTTQGDQILDSPLAKIGGKGLFVKELEQALMDGRADIAVHSMKDVPHELPAGLSIPCILERESPWDALVSNAYTQFESLPQGATVGTSSLRRECQLRALRPDLNIVSLRGNVQTRLRKLDEGHYDAIILAAAGLIRLGLQSRIAQVLDTVCLPAVGQGAIGVECRADDEMTQQLLAPLHHPATAICVIAERAVTRVLGGSCQVPIAAFGELRDYPQGEKVFLRGLVGSPDGQKIIKAERFSAIAPMLGAALAQDLLALGAGEILERLGVSA